MKTILIKEGCPNPISLGEKGENGVSAVLFDYSEWIEDFGNGAISLLVKRKGDSSAYPVVLSTADGIATWTISDTDTAVQGYGKAEYIFTIDDKVAKSAVFSFYVAADLGPSGDPPDPYESWIDTLTELGGETLINAQAAQAAQEAAETAQESAETAATNAESSATAAAQSAGAARFAAESALASSDSASASATAASGHATAAETAKDLAISAAEDAQHSETQAELSASAAAESAESASGSATSASESASVAVQAVTTAASSASVATQAAQNASASATTASNAATNAAASATSASGSASAAATSETNAAQSATSAEASAQEAATEAAKLNNYLPVDTASGSIASFSDGADDVPVEALTVSLEPIQNLNGQTNPYPAGGGKNILAPTFYNGIGYNVAVGTVLTLTEATNVSVSGNTYTRTVGEWGGFGMCSPQLATGTYYLMAELTSVNMRSSIYVLNSDMSVSRNLGNIGSGTTRSIGTVITLSGDEAYIAFNCLTASAGNVSISTPMVALSSTATSFAPYSNICPITGHTQCEVWRSGVNVWDEEWENGYLGIANNSIVYIQSDSRIRSKNWIPVVVGKTYYYQGGGYGAWIAQSDNTDGSNADNLISSDSAGFTFTPTKPYIKFAARAGYGGNYNNNISINYPSTDTDYHAHSIVNITIPLGQTVYGGTLDVVGGKVVVDRAMVTFDGTQAVGLADWRPYNDSSAWLYSPAVTPGFTNQQGKDGLISDRLESIRYSDGIYYDNIGISAVGSAMWGVAMRVPVAGLNTSALINAWLAENPVMVVYDLAEPITIQLSDIPQLTTLYGQNNVCSDSGDVDITYRADIQLYIQKMIAEALT